MTFRLKITGDMPAGTLCRIDIVSHAKRKTLAKKMLTGKDFGVAGRYRDFKLVFTPYFPIHGVAYRVTSFGHVKLWADKITVRSGG